MKGIRSSIATRITAIALAVLIVSTASIGVFSYYLNRRGAIDLSADKALSIARSVSAAVNGDLFEQAMQSLEEDEHWDYITEYCHAVLQQNNLTYLYLYNIEGTDIIYYTEGYNPEEGSEPFGLGEAEDASEDYAQETIDVVSTGQDLTTGIYDSGGYGILVSGYSPIRNSSGRVVGAVGVDISVDAVLQSANAFGLQILAFVAALTLAAGALFIRNISRTVGKPLSALAKTGDSIALGDIDVRVDTSRTDEIGILSQSFNRMIDSSRRQNEVFSALAAGDLSVDIAPRCEKDTMNIAISRMIGNLNSMFTEINQSSSQVSAGARQIADTSQSLAQGSSEQSATVQQLLASIDSVSQLTNKNAEMAANATALSETVRSSAEKGSRQMELMLTATREIGEASQSIGKIIKVIDDIAFQTNILALNAAIEAARAGSQGKGFAVVADEVRNLAGKSAEAAKNTGELISNSIAKAGQGMRIAGDAAESLTEIVSGVNESSSFIGDIAGSSAAQARAISQISEGIESVSKVVMQNTAAATEGAAASQQLDAQADVLTGLVERFKLRGDGTRMLPSGRS